MSEILVFDTEPLIAYLRDEVGADTVGKHLERVAKGEVDAYVSPVTLTEVHYIAHNSDAQTDPDEYINDLRAFGVNQLKASKCWRGAALFKRDYQVALGDAYSLAAAEAVGGALLVGGDEDFDEITDVDIERFREGAS